MIRRQSNSGNLGFKIIQVAGYQLKWKNASLRICRESNKKSYDENNYNRDVIKLAKENKNYPASLEFGKIYRVVADGKAAEH